MNRMRMLFSVLILIVLLVSGCAMAETDTAIAEEPARPDARTLTEMIYDQSTWSEDPSFQSFNAVTLNGEAVNQDIFSGHKVTMLNIWATFCGPCIEEMPYLSSLRGDYSEDEFQVVGLVIDLLDETGINSEFLDLAWQIIDLTHADYMHLIPSYDLSVVKLGEVMAVPETLFFDSEGNLLNPDTPYLGARSYGEWKEIIDSLLAAQAG